LHGILSQEEKPTVRTGGISGNGGSSLIAKYATAIDPPTNPDNDIFASEFYLSRS